MTTIQTVPLSLTFDNIYISPSREKDAPFRISGTLNVIMPSGIQCQIRFNSEVPSGNDKDLIVLSKAIVDNLQNKASVFAEEVMDLLSNVILSKQAG